MTKAALLRHFGHKEALLTAVLKFWEEEEDRGITGEGLDYFRSFAEVLEGHVKNRRLVELFLTLAGEASDPEHPPRAFYVKWHERATEEFSFHVRKAIEAGQASIPEDRKLMAPSAGSGLVTTTTRPALIVGVIWVIGLSVCYALFMRGQGRVRKELVDETSPVTVVPTDTATPSRQKGSSNRVRR